MAINLQARNATLGDLANLLKEQHAQKVDFVAPLSSVVSNNGVFTVKGTSVFEEGSKFLPTEIADAHLASKLGIPPTYLKTLRNNRVDIYDANVNGWTQGHGARLSEMYGIGSVYAGDSRNVLLRTFQSTDDLGSVNVLRAVLSERYGIIDNLDVLMATLDGVREAGTKIDVVGCDLTETRMTVRIAAPELMIHAPRLLAGYRSPFDGNGVFDHSNGRSQHLRNVPEWAQLKHGVNEDGVFAGFVITNSETGGGAFTITPRLMVLKCTNGLMLTKDALRQIHLGGKLQEGVINWSNDTQQKSLALVMSQTRDAVKAFLDVDFMTKAIDGLSEKADTPLSNPSEAIEYVGKQLAYSKEATDGILDHFIRGGQVTAGGVMQAVTSYAQTVSNPDTAFDLESSAVKALELAASR
jgi:hypothetical protein